MLRGHCAIITVAARALEHTEEKKFNEKNTILLLRVAVIPPRPTARKPFLIYFLYRQEVNLSFENTNTNIFVSNYNFDKILFVGNGTGMRAVRGHRSRRVFSFR